jgi:transcriptional regulator with XRE-family HTH domain
MLSFGGGAAAGRGSPQPQCSASPEQAEGEVQELDASELGEMLRTRRIARKMSLAQVAEQAGVSTSFVSQVERGVANPTLSTLKSLVEALGSSVGALLEDDGDWSGSNGGKPAADSGIAVLRAGQRRRIVYPGSSIANELLSPSLQRKMEIIWVEAAPGAGSGGHPHKHEGEECGIVISGEMSFKVGDTECLLGPRDAIYFSSNIPHQWENEGTEELIAIWIITPPTF